MILDRDLLTNYLFVFRRKNPNVELKCVNENENVSRMIAHVLF